MKRPDFAAPLLIWYQKEARDLPWRKNAHPYGIWVSEVMLQQTRVETVIPYYERWLKRFPSIAALATASQQEVLTTWEGLGYYSRARNLHKAAQIVMEELDGKLPSDPDALQELPGIGQYTAGAIASIAFGRDATALDGNIRRVLARFFNVAKPVHSPSGKRIFWDLAAAHLPKGRAGEYNQALMDLGATICKPRAPACHHCPLVENCQAFILGIQEERPVSQPKPAIPHHTVASAVISRCRQVLIAQRPANGLLGGLWEYPGGKLKPGEDLAACLQREICEELGVKINVADLLGVYRHAYTHFKVTLHAFHCTLLKGERPQALQVDDLRWAYLSDLSNYPMGKIDRQISRDLLALEL